MTQPPVHLTIHAIPSTPPEGCNRLCWQVSISTRGGPSSSGLPLEDPLDAEQKADCRWYLEQYVQQSPFSVARAQKAAELLRKYPRELFEQLRLKELVDLIPRDDPSSVLSMSIEILEDTLEAGSTGSTVHQLHWELLEDPALWKQDNIEVLVQRSIRQPERLHSFTNTVQSWPQKNEPGSSVNILLVVARDISRNPAVYSDVSPSMASSILSRLRRDLKETGSFFHLNVEIVRPGTLDSLEKHLQDSQERHGPGYFHIVHFDLHGATHMRKGSKIGYLYFSSPESDETKPEQAAKVGSLMHKYKVPFAVLNSCESARANAGDDANIAKVFEKEGIRSVLAMSFKISSNAAEIFLRSFYRHLLISRSSFSVAVGKARDALRSSPKRHARFGHQKELLDWFVPVCYTCGQDLALTPLDAGLTSPVPDAKSLSGDDGLGYSTELSTGLGGRDFDLLRLEKILLRDRTVYLHGPVGSGKTAFLQYACSIWGETSFVDAIVYLDFAQRTINSADDLVNTIIRQLPASPDQEHGNQLSSIYPASSSYNNTTASNLKDLLSKLRVIIVFDGLHASHTIFGSNVVPGCLRQSALHGINDLLRDILGSDLDLSRREGPYLIFAGRRPDLGWLEKQFDMVHNSSPFRLHGLELGDSIELAQSILREHGHHIEDWRHADIDALEIVLSLLQGLPAALLEVLPQIKTLNVPFSTFYDIIHGGVFRQFICVDSGTQTVFHELQHICRTIPDHLLAPLLSLGFYWHEGPCFGTLSKDMIALGLCPKESHVDLVLAFARDRGYLDLGEVNIITWIHPLFTVYARSLAFVIVNWETPVNTPSGLRALVESAFKWIGSHIRPQSRSTKAAKLMLSALGVDMGSGVQPVPQVDSTAFIVRTLEGLDFKRYLQSFVNITKGFDSEDMRPLFLSGLQNDITCMNICSRDPPIPVANWPRFQFLLCLAFIRGIGSAAEIALCANRCEKLMKCFIKLNGGVVVQPNYQRFALGIVNFLSISHMNEISLPERRHDEFIQLAIDIVTASDQKYGETADYDTLYEKGYVLRYQAFSLLRSQKPKEAVETWEKFLELDTRVRKLLEEDAKANMEANLTILPKETAARFIKLLCQSEGQAEEMEKRLVSVSTHQMEKAFCDSRNDSMKIIKASASLIESGNTGPSEEMAEALRTLNPGYVKIAATGKSSGLTGLEKDARWWPENGDLGLHYYQTYSPLHVLLALEDAADSGNWVRAIEHHKFLLLEAFKEGEFGEVLEHINSIIELYRKDSLFTPALEELEMEKQVIVRLNDYWEAINSGIKDKDAKTAAQRAFGSIDGMTKILEGAKLEQPAGFLESLGSLKILRSMWQKEAQTDSQSLPIWAASSVAQAKQECRSIITMLLQNSNDPEYLKEFATTLQTIMRLNQMIYDDQRSGKPEDLDHALSLCLELEKLATTKFGRDLIDKEQIPRDKELLSYKRDWNASILAWKESAEKGDWAEAARQLNISLELKQSHPELHALVGSTSDPTFLQKRAEMTEIYYWNQLFEAASSTDDDAESARLYDELLALYDRGTFSHIDPATLSNNVISAKSYRLIRLIWTTAEASEFQACIKHCDELLELNAAKIAEDSSSHDFAIAMRERAEIRYYNNEYLRADFEMDFPTALMYVDKMEEACERMKRTPEVHSSGAAEITPELLMAIRQQLHAKLSIMQEMGDVLGRQVIQASRQMMGYTPQFK